MEIVKDNKYQQDLQLLEIKFLVKGRMIIVRLEILEYQ